MVSAAGTRHTRCRLCRTHALRVAADARGAVRVLRARRRCAASSGRPTGGSWLRAAMTTWSACGTKAVPCPGKAEPASSRPHRWHARTHARTHFAPPHAHTLSTPAHTHASLLCGSSGLANARIAAGPSSQMPLLWLSALCTVSIACAGGLVHRHSRPLVVSMAAMGHRVRAGSNWHSIQLRSRR
jgi:hypothetical protein